MKELKLATYSTGYEIYKDANPQGPLKGLGELKMPPMGATTPTIVGGTFMPNMGDARGRLALLLSVLGDA